MDAIAKDPGQGGGAPAWLARLRALINERGAHPARTVVLVPYAQLMPLARQSWAAEVPDGFAPRFETTLNWASRGGFAPGEEDLSFERGLDLLGARHWLDRAGLGGQAALLAPRLVDAAWQLAGPAAAVHPHHRAGWAERVREQAGLGLEHPVLALEAAVARIAIEWAAASAYVTDTLLAGPTLDELDLLVVLEGLQPEPVTQAVAATAGERAVCWPLDHGGPPGQLTLHRPEGPANEAEMAAACVMRHLEAGRSPVALAAVDRVLTRRIRAMLAARGVAVRDETGWKLSTTRAAARVMSVLRAGSWNASSDEVLDWLKHTPAAAPGSVLALERRVRRAGLRQWSSVSAARLGGEPGGWSELIERANAWRERLRAARPMPLWQQVLR
jgi:ATP-dependent helicase/nuclease subunit B